MLSGTLPGIAGSQNESMSIGTPFENSSWFTPLLNADNLLAKSLRVDFGNISL